MIYSVVLVLGVQQSDSIVHIHISIGVSMCVCLLILTSGIIPDCLVAFIFSPEPQGKPEEKIHPSSGYGVAWNFSAPLLLSTFRLAC